MSAHHHLAKQKRAARISRSVAREVLAAEEAQEDLEDLLVRSNEMQGVFFCAACRLNGTVTRVAARGDACMAHWRGRKARAAA